MATTDRTRFADSRHRHDPAEVKPATVICPKGKIGLSREVAVAKLVEYRKDGRRPTRPVRIYECPECSTPERPSWHLTSQPQRQGR